MLVLAIDPSSTRTGYALLKDSMTILDAGLLKPNKTRDPAIKRVIAMTKDVRALLYDYRPDVALVEMPHKHNKPRHKNLAIYGVAAGTMLWVCYEFNLHSEEGETHPVNAETWTEKISKDIRQDLIQMQFDQYDPAKDPGGDIADAIGLALWWFSKQKAERIAG